MADRPEASLIQPMRRISDLSITCSKKEMGASVASGIFFFFKIYFIFFLSFCFVEALVEVAVHMHFKYLQKGLVQTRWKFGQILT